MSVFTIMKKAVSAGLKRTGYNAIYNGKVITGCFECGNNKTFPGAIPGMPTHKCIVTCTSDESLMTIFDPYNIPEDCPLKVEGEKV